MSRKVDKEKRKYGMRFKYIGLCIMFMFIFILTGCTLQKTYGNAAVDTRAGGSLYAPDAVSVANKTLYWRQEIKQAALDMINRSRKVCYLSMYELGDQDVLQALARAHTRGVDVRLVLDATEKHTLHIAVPFLQQNGIPYHLYRVKKGISHIKSLVTDDHGSLAAFDELMGGMNFGPHSWDNLDASIYIHAANDDFERLFLRDWAVSAGKFEPVEDSSQFVIDQQIKPALLQAIQSAQRSIDIEIFDISDRDLIQQLIVAQARGVHVRILLEPTERQNQQTAKLLKKTGIETKFYKHVSHEILHAKLMSVDAGRIVIIGSANFTHQGFYVNHEGDLVLKQVPQFGKVIQQCLDAEWGRSR